MPHTDTSLAKASQEHDTSPDRLSNSPSRPSSSSTDNSATPTTETPRVPYIFEAPSPEHIPAEPPAAAPSGLTRRSASSHKLNQQHGTRHVVRPHIGGRTMSFGRNLSKLASKNNHPSLHLQSDAAMAPSATTSTPHRAQNQRPDPHSLHSPAATPASPRPSHSVKRNASAFTVTRTTTHSALKKNHSSGHLPRHGSSKNVAKAARHAFPMRRTQSSKSVSSQKSQKSQNSPIEAQHPTVRFDLGDEIVPDDRTSEEEEEEDEVEEDEDNAWTEDSTSLSPTTTRDHTRQNSVTLDSSTLHAINLRASIMARGNTTKQSSAATNENRQPESTTLRRNASSHSILTPDAITSRLLMRNPSVNPVAVSNISVTALGTPDQSRISSFSQLSGSQDSIMTEAASSGSGGRDLVSRFLAGGNSHVPNSEIFVQTLEDRQGRHDSEDQGYDSDNQLEELDLHRRNRSTPSMTGTTKAGGRTPVPANIILPPSRTLQKLELQRASTMVEPAMKIPVAPLRPTAPLLLSSGVNTFGFGHGEEDTVPAQVQGLFAQIDKEYAVIRRFRRPVDDAISRISRKHGLSESPVNGTAGGASVAGKAPSMELGYSKPNGRGSTDDAEPEHSPELKSPVHLNSRRSKVAFELPSRQTDDAAETEESRPSSRAMRREEREIRRRMWDLSNVVNMQD
jgi:hypothetical protein